MKITTIPQAFEYTCDCCGDKHLQENAGGHYTQSTPPGWLNVRYWRASADKPAPACDPGDFHKSAEVLFCVICRKRFDQFWIAEMRQT